MITQWPHQSLVASFYGNPDTDRNGVPDRAWEDAALTSVVPPYRMVLAWDETARVKTIRVHKKCADSLLRILTNIAKHYGSEQDIQESRMDRYGGCYNFRTMRGAAKLSNHAYGAAIDLDPAMNPLGLKYVEADRMMPMAVVRIFEAEGWAWGGRWKRADCQHFQAVTS